MISLMSQKLNYKIGNTVQGIPLYFDPADTKDWADIAQEVLMYGGVKKVYAPASKVKTINGTNFSGKINIANKDFSAPEWELHNGSSDTQKELFATDFDLSGAAGQTQVHVSASISFRASYGAKEDGWCWTRYYITVNGNKISNEAYFTKSHGGVDRTCSVSGSIWLPKGKHHIAFIAYNHASNGDDAHVWFQKGSFSMGTNRESAKPSKVHFKKGGEEYVFLLGQ